MNENDVKNNQCLNCSNIALSYHGYEMLFCSDKCEEEYFKGEV